MLNVFAVLFAAFGRWFRRNAAFAVLCLATLLSACSMTGSAATSSPTGTMPPLDLSHHVVREVCWQPSEFGEVDDNDDANDDENYFVLAKDGTAIPSKNRTSFISGLEPDGIVYKYVRSAPIENLRVIPLSRTDAWCSRIPKPRDAAIRRMLNLCSGPTVKVKRPAAAKNLFGDAESPSIPSPLFCGQRPRMEMTTQEAILLRNKIEAWQESYNYAHKTKMALTYGEAKTEAVINKSDSWLKQALTSDPGSIEQIQQQLADTLNSIEEPPTYDDPILEGIALAGFNAGYDDGKFEVEAKLFAIDAGVMLIEFAAMEIALV